jgi:hypothetical protein
MKPPEKPISQLYALLHRINSLLLWVSSPEFVSKNYTALSGVQKRLYNAADYVTELLSLNDKKNSTE